MTHLVLIDGHHLMYRAYWAIPRTLSTSRGEQTNAVFGFASMILSILAKEQPDSLLICFDAGEETFRHQEHTEYKAGRAETPDDFYTQIPKIIECVHAFSLPHISHTSFEADDLLATYATAAKRQQYRTTIVTGDRDALQLASDNIRIAIPHKGYQQTEYLGPQEVLAKYGVTPQQIPAYKGLSGDTSDNLPGVRGIGPKTAARLLQQYQSIEGIYQHLSEIKPSVKEKLEQDREQAFFCQRMARLISTIELPVPLELLAIDRLPTEAILAFFQEMEFTLLQRRLQQMMTSPYGLKHFIPLSGSTAKYEGSLQNNNQLSLFSEDE